jgi:hypothetical protein
MPLRLRLATEYLAATSNTRASRLPFRSIRPGGTSAKSSAKTSMTFTVLKHPFPLRTTTREMCCSARLQLDVDPRVVSQQPQLHDRPAPSPCTSESVALRSSAAPITAWRRPAGPHRARRPRGRPHGSQWLRELSRSGRSGGRSGSLLHIDRGAAPHSIDEQVTDDPQFTQRRRNREGIRQRLRLRQQIADKCTQ